jgi:hypothetical protein
MSATPSAGFRQYTETEPDEAVWRAMQVADAAKLARTRPAEGDPLPDAPLTSTGAMRAIREMPEIEVPAYATGPEAAGRLLKAMQGQGWPEAVASDLTPAAGDGPAFPRRPAGAWDAYVRGEHQPAPVPADAPAPYAGRHSSAFNSKGGAADTGSFPALRPELSRNAWLLQQGTPVDITMEPVIGDRMAVPLSFRPEQPGTSALLYSGPGWTDLLTRSRVRSGDWEDPFQGVKPGWVKNAADEAGALINVRENIARAARRLCRALGQPDQAPELLARVREIELAGDDQ